MTPLEKLASIRGEISVAEAENTEILQANVRGLSLTMVSRPSLNWEA